MRIRILAASAVLAAALVAPVIPAVADEGSATPAPSVTEEPVNGTVGATSTPSPSPTARPNDLGWG